MDADELLDWEILEDIDPWGQLREDYRLAVLISQMMNAARLRKPGGQLFSFKDFLLDFFPRPVVRQPTAQVEAEIMAWVKSTNAMFKEQGQEVA